ncbi:MAG: hypothetical protein ACOC8B_00900, partial [Gemmatimonadota bacterium]
MNATLGRNLWLSAVFIGLVGDAARAPAAVQTHHINLEENFPLEVEDAYPGAYGSWELELPFRYDRTRDGRNLYELVPEVAYGIVRNADISVAVPVRFGTADRTGSGDIEVEAFYNFNTEGLVLPAFALEGAAIVPSGRDTDGVDTRLRLIATRSISNRLDRLHANVQYEHNDAPLPGEHDHRWLFILGYSGRLGPDMLIVADIIREQERMEDEAANVVELGLRAMIAPLVVGSAAFGTGFGDESPP